MIYNSLINQFVESGVKTVIESTRYRWGRSVSDDGAFTGVYQALVKNEDLARFIKDGTDMSSVESFLRKSNAFGEDLYSTSEFWKDYIDSKLEEFEEESGHCLIGSSSYDKSGLYLQLVSSKSDYAWNKGFQSLISTIESSKQYCAENYISKYFEQYLDKDPTSFKKDVESVIFNRKLKAPYGIRGSLYRHYCRGGFCTEKTARKMRSDGSSDASYAGLKAIIDNKELYPNVVNLYLQFTDSRYEFVLKTLAENLPVHLLPSIMGNDFWSVKRTIENRMREHEDSQERSDSTASPSGLNLN
tara:strand:+ start:6546 stop:7448 length:903 start_codon:yes stop_codon:yes gene_type:complete